jgi:Glycosyltransferase family 87
MIREHIQMKEIRLVVLLSLTLIACAWVLKWSHTHITIDGIGGDFAGYWTSCHLLLNGEDPYSSEKILSVQKLLGWTRNDPLIIYNLPLVFTFLMPFCLSNFNTDKIIWMIFTMVLMMFSADRLWLIYGGSRETRVWAPFIMATFVPVLLAYKLGQIVFLMLFGLVGFQYFAKKEKWWLAGMMTVFFAVKPHTIYLFWFALLFWAMKHRLWTLLLGSMFPLLCVTLLPLFYNPNVYTQYFSSIVMKSYALSWATPTLGTFLRLSFGSQHEWLQYIPMLAGLIWFFNHWHKYRNKWIWENQFSILILVSLMTNFYIWSWDYLMLIPAVIQVIVRIYQNPGVRFLEWIVLLYIMINVFAFISTFFFDSHWYILMPYALLINYIFATKQLDAIRTDVQQANAI